MRAEQARVISREACEIEGIEKARKREDTLARLRAHPEYSVGREVADLGVALKHIEKTARFGYEETSYHVKREGRPPTSVQAAQALGESETIANQLRDLGYEVEVGFLFPTHDYDGQNGIVITSSIKWK